MLYSLKMSITIFLYFVFSTVLTIHHAGGDRIHNGYLYVDVKLFAILPFLMLMKAFTWS